MTALRVLFVSHGHPELSIGGGENAAYAQFNEVHARGVPSMFIARTGYILGHEGAAFSNRTADGSEVLFSTPPVELFRHSQPNASVIYRDFRLLLERFNPTVVHFHHFVHLGLEMIREVRKFSVHCKIVLTLHEYLAICNANGQMLKTSGLLCNRAAPVDCHVCFPMFSPQDFFIRELFVKSFLKLCDHFVCPSAFLRQRYIEWGLLEHKMTVLENGQPVCPVPRSDIDPSLLHLKFVVLGQLSELKGTLVVLDAARLLPSEIRRMVSIEIHGSMQQYPEDFRKLFECRLEGLSRIVRYCGPYRTVDVGSIIQRNGWVIQPSIWWENSPLVIQEAFAAGRPVICSNIGGMAEKVTHGVSGLLFRVGSASDLASCIEGAARRPALWETLCKGLPVPPTIQQTGDALLTLYTSSIRNEFESPSSRSPERP